MDVFLVPSIHLKCSYFREICKKFYNFHVLVHLNMTKNHWIKMLIFNSSYFFKDFIYLFLERGKEGEREGEKHQCVVASHVSPTGDLAHNPGMCPDWESNRWPFGSQARTQSTNPHQPGQKRDYFYQNLFNLVFIEHP